MTSETNNVENIDVENNDATNSYQTTNNTKTVTNVNTPTTDKESNDSNTIRGRIDKLENSKIGTKGTFLSFLLLVLGVIASIIAQNYEENNIPVNSSIWLIDCPSGYDSSCVGNGAVYRFSFALTLVFVIQFIGTSIHIKFYDMLWIYKYLIFIALVVLFYYTSANVFDEHGYAWFARIAGFLYVILQQVILIDFAYTMNESAVAYAEKSNSTSILVIIVIISLILLIGSYGVMGVMFYYLTECNDIKVILSLTICLTVISTCIQLFVSDHGSLLTSSIMTAYAIYICYSAVTLNPYSQCNPTISTSYQSVSTAIGLGILVISLTWTAKSVIDRIPGTLGEADPRASRTAETNQVQGLRIIFQEVSGVFVLISAYYAMVLTNWATLQANNDSGSSRSGLIAMWLQAAAQWIALVMYSWSLIAPKLFPDREF